MADASGLFPPIYLTNALFKVVLSTSADVVVQTIDPCFGNLVAGGTFGFGDGSVGTPAIGFSADPDTGIYRIGTNSMGLVAGGALIAQVDGNGLTVKDALFKLIDDSDATKAAKFQLSGITTGQTRNLTLPDSDGTLALTSTANLQGLFQSNIGLVASVSAGALTIALKGVDGNDPSSSNVVTIPFRSSTAATGTPVIRTVTGATSIVVASTKTLGTANATAFRLWVVAVDTGSGIELGVVNCLSGTSIMALRDGLLYSPTATPGNSAQVIYTTSGQTSKPIAILGYLDFSSGEATAGTWATAPDRIQFYRPGVPLPGDVIQVQRNETGASATGTTIIPFDDTIPQNTEGTQFMTQSITPSASANLLCIESWANYSSTAADGFTGSALFQDSTANALAAAWGGKEAANRQAGVLLQHKMLAATASSTTMKIRGGSLSAGTVTFNGLNGSRVWGGVLVSYMEITEIMA